MSREPSAAGPGDRRVLLTDHPWPEVAIERAICAAHGIALIAGPQAAGTERAIERLVERVDPHAILTCWAPVSARAIAAPSRLACVVRLGVGLDNIAVPAATARGAWVANVPDYCVEEVSDHAVALLLAHFRGIVRLDAAAKRHLWLPAGDGLERISGLTVAVIGYGRIGRETARKLKAFGCRLLAVARSPVAEDGIVLPADLARVQEEADAIVLHAPLTAGTAGMIGEAFLSRCRKRPLLVNVGRGGLVDNDALLDALDRRLLRGAALDVVEGEPKPPARILGHPAIIVTPHVAFASRSSIEELRRRACEEAVRVLRGEPPRHPCNDPVSALPV